MNEEPNVVIAFRRPEPPKTVSPAEPWPTPEGTIEAMTEALMAAEAEIVAARNRFMALYGRFTKLSREAGVLRRALDDAKAGAGDRAAAFLSGGLVAGFIIGRLLS